MPGICPPWADAIGCRQAVRLTEAEAEEYREDSKYMLVYDKGSRNAEKPYVLSRHDHRADDFKRQSDLMSPKLLAQLEVKKTAKTIIPMTSPVNDGSSTTPPKIE
eukprot:992732-Prorocentrum_minimum.AAC.1